MQSSTGRRSPARWLLWGLGNVLILAGVFAILYVGGLQAYISSRALQPYDPAETPLVRQAPALRLAATPSPGLPLLNWADPEEAPPPPTPSPLWHSSLSRIRLPSIAVDSGIVAVGWHVEEVSGQAMTIWDVAKYAVGHHQGSGNPGDGDNIVLAGHSGGFGAVFRRLGDLQPGDEVLLEGADQLYLYVVEEVLFLKEVGVPMEERLRNAQYMAPTDEERVTLITCWPVRVYDHRIVVLARPYRAAPFGRPDWREN